MDNNYFRRYFKTEYHKDRDFCLETLGGICVKCGTDESLEFDHIDPSTRCFVLSDKFGRVKRKTLIEELSKCQLLCKTCHAKKTVFDEGKSLAQGTHGTLSSYRYCKCDVCREAKRASNRMQYEKRKPLDEGRNGVSP